MGFLRWFTGNWFIFLQNAGIIGGLLFSGLSLRADTRAWRATNLIAITQNHREIWTQLYTRPELSRILSAHVVLRKKPVTLEEELFVRLLILHLNTSYQAAREGVFTTPERLCADIQHFFSLPIPHAVWQKEKPMQDGDFVGFVESSIKAS
jgi:hypothetical protein